MLVSSAPIIEKGNVRFLKIAIQIKKLEDDVEKFRKEVEGGKSALAANVAQHGEVTKEREKAEEKLAGAKKKFDEDLLAEGFVDEGFGSLDAESLDMALRTLQELQGAGTASDRAVGIISHIDEVKKAVGKRIEVTRNPGEATSTVEIMN